MRFLPAAPSTPRASSSAHSARYSATGKFVLALAWPSLAMLTRSKARAASSSRPKGAMAMLLRLPSSATVIYAALKACPSQRKV